MDEVEYDTIIQWYCRQGYFNSMFSNSKKALDMYPSVERFRVYLAMSLALTNQSKEALQEVSLLIGQIDSTLPGLLIQSYVYNVYGTNEKMQISLNDSKIQEETRKSSPYSLALAATVLLLFDRIEKAKEFINRAYKLNPNDSFIILTKAWCYIDSQEKNNPDNNYFEMILQNTNKHFHALFGLAIFKKLQKEFSDSISILNSLIVRYPKLSLPLIEKSNNLLALRDWDQALEVANRILVIENSNLDAIKLKAVIIICKNGDYIEAVKHVQAFFRNFILAEGKNIELFVNNMQLFVRIATRNRQILIELFKITDKMLQLNPGNPDIMVELGNLCAQMEKIKDAEHWYRSAIKIDETSYSALLGLSQCQFTDVSTSTENIIKQQINFLYELNLDNIKPQLMIMTAKMYHNQPSKAVEELENASEILINNIHGLSYGFIYLKTLNPDLCLEIVKEYLLYSSNSFDKGSDIFVNIGKSPCIIILEKVIDACPGFNEALLLLGKIRLQNGDFEGALTVLRKLLDHVDPTNVAGHLLTAEILIQQGEFHQASQALEVGLSCNFKVRDDPLYYMILGVVDKEKGNLESAVKNFETAMSLGGFNKNDASDNASRMSISDETTLYLQLISTLCKLRKFSEATELMNDLSLKLTGTVEEGRAIIGNADLCLEMEDIDKAIEYLTKISPGQMYYLQAHTKLAEIYLYRRKDRYLFARCFRDLVTHCPGPKTYNMLGDAYLAIQEPEKAIEAYELSMKNSPGDKILARKMGVALVKTHQYTKAINYYKMMMKREDCKDLKLDMAELYLKLKQYNRAEDILVDELNEGRNDNNLQALELRSKQLLMLAKVREKAGRIKEALTTLNEAKDNQIRYIQRSTISNNEIDPKLALAEICFSIAEHATSIRDFKQAIANYKEVLNYKPNDIKALLSLAKLYMQMNDLDKCTHYCTVLLTSEPHNESACVMMADLAFRKVDFETAAFHFRQLLTQKPGYWTALARLIEVSRRTGIIDDLKDWLTKSEAAMDKSKPEAGYYYCAGLFEWRTGKLSTALRRFNAARRDSEWGQQSIYNMIEICLDFEGESIINVKIYSDEDNDYEDTRTNSLKMAKRLLQELNPKGNAQEMITHRLLTNFYLLATRVKSNIERAVQDCTALLSLESFRDHVGPALGLATAHILLKQMPRARNHLKRVSKNIWTFEDAEYLERCWLLLAEIHCENGKNELAIELLRKILQHNASCIRAHELYARIAFKDGDIKESSVSYAKAWKYGGKSKVSIGAKLAYNYFKCKQYAEAIEICNQVLKLDPDNTKIKKDVLEKALASLRT